MRTSLDGLRRGTRDVPQRAGERRARRPAAVDLRAPAVGPLLPRAHGRQLVPARVPVRSRRSSRRRAAADAAQHHRAALRPVRPRLLAAGLLSRRADRADGARRRSRSSTVVVGRIWCGWLCPQTIFLEMLFRKIEYLIDGSARAAAAPRPRAVDAPIACCAPAVKHAIFFALSFVIANVFLAYIIGADALRTIVTDPPRSTSPACRDHDLQLRVLRRLRAIPRAGVRAGLPVRAGDVGAASIAHTITVTYDSRPRRAARASLAAAVAVGAAAPRRLHRLPPVRHGLPDRHRHPQRHPARVRQLHGLHRRLRRRDDAADRPRGLIR